MSISLKEGRHISPLSVKKLDSNIMIAFVTLDVNLKNAYFKFIRKEGFEKLASYQNGGVQKISKRRIIRWFKQCNCKIKRLKWIATPRLEKITRFGPRLLGPLLGAEMIVLGKRGRN